MTFNFTQRHKIIAIALVVLGLVAIVAGFMTGHGDNTRSWASLLLGNYFFMGVSLAALTFVAIQYVAEVGWSAMIKRIPLAIMTYIPIGVIIMMIIFAASGHDIYHWKDHDLVDPSSPKFDKILYNKAAWLNVPFFWGRMIAYLIVWSLCMYFIRKNNIAEDTEGGTKNYMKNSRISAGFLVFFLVTSSTMAWDFIMSIDAHWFSTLFGWYNFASIWVSGLSMMGLIVVYCYKQGIMPKLLTSHIHDNAKFIFAFSIFWTYLWFSQFMLYWYANLPEEVVYFFPRQGHYRALWLLNFVINFIAPFLMLMSRDTKRKLNSLMFVAVLVMVGHWLDMYLMIFPGTVGDHGTIGFVEVGSTMFFAGIFMFVVLRNLAAAPIVAPNHPMMAESELFNL